eukprot:scaffold24636_cov31-Tisochrysis_lutea.AAC.6
MDHDHIGRNNGLDWRAVKPARGSAGERQEVARKQLLRGKLNPAIGSEHSDQGGGCRKLAQFVDVAQA